MVAKKIYDASQQQEKLEKDIQESCNKVPDVKITDEEPLAEKVLKLTLTIKESKNTLVKLILIMK